MINNERSKFRSWIMPEQHGKCVFKGEKWCTVNKTKTATSLSVYLVPNVSMCVLFFFHCLSQGIYLLNQVQFNKRTMTYTMKIVWHWVRMANGLFNAADEANTLSVSFIEFVQKLVFKLRKFSTKTKERRRRRWWREKRRCT